MRKVLFFFALFVAGFRLDAQTFNFQNLANMNLQLGATSCAADSINLYLTGGFTPSTGFTTQIEKYDIVANSWSIFTNALVPKRFCNSAIVGNNLYIFNGNLSSGYNTKTEVVDLGTGAVTYSTDNPVPVSNGGAAVWNQDIYVFGGSTAPGVYSIKLYKFSTTNQTWTPLADMLEAKETKGEIINGILYVIGGYHGADARSIDKYDIAANTWSNLMTMPDSVSDHSTAVYGSKIYILGDYNQLTHFSCYDVSTNTYSAITEANWIGRRNAGAAMVNGKLYSAGGNTSGSSASALSSTQMVNLLSVGIETFKMSRIRIYPNPVSDKLTLDFGKDVSSQEASIRIMNSLGQVIFSKRIDASTENLSLSDWAVKGFYYVQILNIKNEILGTQKIIVD
jgi:N-acetylneuraminic acid mutarotase